MCARPNCLRADTKTETVDSNSESEAFVKPSEMTARPFIPKPRIRSRRPKFYIVGI